MKSAANPPTDLVPIDDLDQAIVNLCARINAVTYELLEKALDKARDGSSAEAPEFIEESWSTQQADAFVNLVNGYLSGDGHTEANSSDNYLVTIHVDQSALAGGDGRSAVPIETAKRLCRDGQAVVLTEDEKGDPLSIGRKTCIGTRLSDLLNVLHRPVEIAGKTRHTGER